MELGLAIGIFVIVAIILMSLFCLVTRYFNYRLRKALEQQAQTYSLVQGIQGEKQDINEGEYQDFVYKRIQDRKKKQLEKDKNHLAMIQMTEINIAQPVNNVNTDLYGISKLKRKLTGEDKIPINVQSTRSLVSRKNFQPDKLGSFRDKQSGRSTLMKGQYGSIKKPDVINYTYLNKIICYTQQNLTIIQINVLQLWRQTQNGVILQKKNAFKVTVDPQELGFEDALQAYGFEKGIYGSYKFQTTVEIVNMKPRQIYSTQSLKKTQQKQPMQFASFYYKKDQLVEKQILDQKKKNIPSTQFLNNLKKQNKGKHKKKLNQRDQSQNQIYRSQKRRKQKPKQRTKEIQRQKQKKKQNQIEQIKGKDEKKNKRTSKDKKNRQIFQETQQRLDQAWDQLNLQDEMKENQINKNKFDFLQKFSNLLQMQ